MHPQANYFTSHCYHWVFWGWNPSKKGRMQQKKQESPAADAAAVDPAVDPAGGPKVVPRWSQGGPKVVYPKS